ncbi:6-phosphofructo-2-kinase/fructose-2,6-biphosphatase, putative [Leishmania panamensis]|uniref:6-phosphofructo-2-kinase/fructose-2,6-biphosphatase, putative n=1 Tax=Leishmania panamensis TaxID=5679 RepID=A0A088RKT5_LEIPA|nr:6-phosphofructo-2-kinase/fructose-2,6-biphosphatase, putative [Leishmania panamensis]AIN95769.1 6-phosphofructo-2-kinase/fructose-2,6-biphosphatase, putative [Leishmania panamensis]
MESNTAVTPPPSDTDAAALKGDARATATHHVNMQRSNGGVSALAHASSSRVRTLASASSYSTTAQAAAMSPSLPKSGVSSATSHVKAVMLHGVTHPTAHPVAEAEQPNHNFSFQAGEEPARANVTTSAAMHSDALCRGSPQLECHTFVDPHADTVEAEASAPCRLQARHHHHCGHYHCGHSDAHRSRPASVGKGAAATATTTTAAASATNTHLCVSSQDLPLIHHSNTSDGSGSRGTSCSSSGSSGRHSTRSYDNLTVSCASAASFMGSQTPVNFINTAYHRWFSPELLCLGCEAIVERIVGQRPRPYHRWVWRKAKDYQELHALNVHKNNAYQNPAAAADHPVVVEAMTGCVAAVHPDTAFKASPTASSTLSPGGAAGGVSQGTRRASLKVPLPTVLSDSSSSPVAGVVGLTDAGERVSNSGRCATADSSAPSWATAATPPTKSPSGLNHLPSTGSTENAAGGSELLHTSSTEKDMPFGVMSQLSVYTIPTSQQGPQYFKTTTEDGTKTLVIVMMGLPARGKTFLAQKICRLLGWHGSRAKVQNIQVAWRRMLLDWEAAHPERVTCSSSGEAPVGQEASASAAEARIGDEVPSCERGASHGIPRPTGAAGEEGTITASLPATATVVPVQPAFTRSDRLAGRHSTQSDVTRNVPSVVTGSLNASLRRATATNISSVPTLASTFTPAATKTATATTTYTNATTAAKSSPSCSLSDIGAAAGQRSSVNTPFLCLDRNTPSVCPSMQAHTAALLEDSTATPLPASAAASSLLSGTHFPATTVANVTEKRSRGSVTRHSPTADTPPETTSDGGAPRLEASAGIAPHITRCVDNSPLPAEVLRTRHFRELIEQPTSVARRLYRYVLQSFAEDCRLFFQHGGEVVVVNDDFITEELRQEAERLFRPLAAQFFYIEVIRDAEEDPLDLVRCKARDPVEYPLSDINPGSAADDLHERLAFLESVYETLKEAPQMKSNARQTPTTSAAGAAATATEVATGASVNTADGHSAKTQDEGETAIACSPTTLSQSKHHQQQLAPPRSYVKIMNSNTIETQGVSGYLASRIISYVMSLSQVKIQHPIYFVLHGESLYNVEGRIGGNPSLTEQGMLDAVALLEFLGSLKRRLEHVDREQYVHNQKQEHHSRAVGDSESCSSATAAFSPNMVGTLEMWTSQLQRAIQTTELSERLLNIRTLRWSSLNEIHAGVCEDMTYAEVKERYPLIDYFRRRNKYSFRYPEGESYQDLVIRLEPVIMELENADKVVVVVAHQAVLRCLLAYFGSTSAESSIGVEVPHRTVWRCTYDSKGIASLDELKLDNYEVGLHLPKGKGSQVESATNPSSP